MVRANASTPLASPRTCRSQGCLARGADTCRQDCTELKGLAALGFPGQREFVLHLKVADWTARAGPSASSPKKKSRQEKSQRILEPFFVSVDTAIMAVIILSESPKKNVADNATVAAEPASEIPTSAIKSIERAIKSTGSSVAYENNANPNPANCFSFPCFWTVPFESGGTTAPPLPAGPALH